MISSLQRSSCFLAAVYIITLNLLVLGAPLLAATTASSAAQGLPEVLGATTTVPAVRVPNLISPLDLTAIQAKSFLVYDPASKTVLAYKNSDHKLPVASISKLMIAYLVNQFGDLADTITITSQDTFSVSPMLGLQRGDRVQVQDLLYAMLVGSANDAAQTLSNYLEKKTDRTMVDLMAEAATQLGMSSSQFKDPIGFDSLTTYTTATDVTYLLNALFNSSILDQVGRRLSYGFRSVDGVTYVTHATNKLIEADPELFAIKTGYTTIARGAMISRVVHEGQTFVIIVLGSTDREADTLLLKREVLSHFQW